MNRPKSICVAALLLWGMLALSAQTYRNPVIPGIADAGCVRYAGKYYLGGVATLGDFFVSSDLVNWPDRIHVFDLDNQWTHGTGARNNQVHADDISYSNGKFHLLFSVNYWGRDRHIVHITHATSDSISGPFREVREDQWYENRIDPMVFRDDDGRLYLYMVKFTDGNTIWGRPLNQDFTFAGDAVQQFSSQPGTWETLDNRVAEGPFVVKYRGRYYMMYNANHTAPEYGNYRLGVCEVASPLGFNPGGKYSHPVVEPNTIAMDDAHPDLLLYGTGRYVPATISRSQGGADTIHFTLARIPEGNTYLKVVQRGGCHVKVNGMSVNGDDKADYTLFPIDKKALKEGGNEIVVDKGRGTLSAISLYDFGNDTPDDLLVTPGQPNIVRGPNGWEWWLVYMANVGWRRSQFIDRIHFNQGRLTVDGITGPHTTGFHPAPALPQYAGQALDSVDFSDSYLLELTMKGPATRQGIDVGGTTVALPDSMDHDVAHEWRIEKNHELLTVWVDKILLRDHVAIDASAQNVTLMGDKRSYDMDYVSYNEGYDEYADNFSGWEGLTAGDNGLQLKQGRYLKGGAATDYELSVQTDDHGATTGAYGIMAAYVDDKNYVSAQVDIPTASLVITKVEKGKKTSIVKPLGETVDAYPDVKNTDSFEKQYRFDSDTYLTAILLPHQKPDNDPYASDLGIVAPDRKGYVEDVIASQQVAYLDGDTWKPLPYEKVASPHPAWQRLKTDNVKTRGLRFINGNPTDMHRNLYRIKVEKSRQSVNQLRVDKRGQNLHFFVNGKALGTVNMKRNVPTRCGVVSDGNADVTIGNTLYYIIKQ